MARPRDWRDLLRWRWHQHLHDGPYRVCPQWQVGAERGGGEGDVQPHRREFCVWPSSDLAQVAFAPNIEVMPIQAQLANGDWLALSDGLRPESIPPRALAE